MTVPSHGGAAATTEEMRPLGVGRRIWIVAGEVSGDRLGAGLLQALRERTPELEAEAMGGAELRAAGARILVDSTDLGVTGIVEALRELRRYRQAFRTLEERMRDDPPDLIVLVDFPDFNLRLAGVAHDLGVPVVYFVSPQVWAWRRRRVRLIARRVRKMLVIFPFEEAFYRNAGVDAVYVGHPAVGRLATAPTREAARSGFGIGEAETVVALLPGSRENEVRRILPDLGRAAQLLSRRLDPPPRFLLPVAPGLPEELLLSSGGGPPIRLHRGPSETVLRAADVAAVASGTATLETALLGTPLVAVYRLQPLSYLLGRLLVRVPHVAMPNLIAGRRAVPELVQGGFTPELVAEEVGRLLEEPEAREKQLAALEEIRRRLGGPGAYARAAGEILAVLSTIGGE